MAEDKELPPPSETVKKLRETFTPLAARLQPEDEPAIVYTLEPKPE
jgi:hypothetical protein